MESKIEATHRLQREGRWGEASAYRDNVRKELRNNRMTRMQAGEASWERMIEAFPPLPEPTSEPEPESRQLPIPQLPNELYEDSCADWVADTVWAYRTHASKVTEQDAPSASAWAMRTWARNNIETFYRHVYPKAEAESRRRITEQRQVTDEVEAKAIAEVLKMASDAVKFAKREVAPIETQSLASRESRPASI